MYDFPLRVAFFEKLSTATYHGNLDVCSAFQKSKYLRKSECKRPGFCHIDLKQAVYEGINGG